MRKINRILLLVMIMALMFVISGCTVKREEGVKEFFTAVSKGDITEMKKFLGDDSKAVNFESSVQETMVKTIYKHTSYKIISSKKDIVEVEITTPNGINLFAEGSNILMEAQIKGQNEVQDFPEQLDKIVERVGFPKITTKVKIKINKESKKWIIDKNEELENAITSNLM